MVRNIRFSMWLCACALVPLAAAQNSAPLTAGSQVPMSLSAQGAQPSMPAHPSAWDGYQPWQSPEVGDWRQANALVGRIGGWRVYAREVAPIVKPAAPTEHTP